MDTPQTPAPQDLNHKQMKALAKASRPWYAKKRFWALGVIGFIIIASAVGSNATKGTTSTTSNGGVSTLSNNGSNPPQADVAITSCTTALIGPEAALRITNHSSGRSNYMISVNFLDAAGTKIAEGAAISNNIDPGQSAVEKATGFTEAKGALTCKVVNVNRFAAH
jgi:hypothetical protein